MEKMNSEKFSEKITLSKEDEAYYLREVEYYCDKNRCSEDKAIKALGLDYLKNTGIFDVDYNNPNAEQDLLNIPENLKYAQISDNDWESVDKLMDKTGISSYEALIRLNLINNDNIAPQLEPVEGLDGLSEITSPEAPSVRIDKRNVALRQALHLALSASKREGFIHKIEKNDEQVDANYQAKRRNDESKAANDFLDEATGINSMRKAGVDEEIIAKMASEYHKNFRDEYTGVSQGPHRDKFRRIMANEAKVYNIHDIDIWNRR